MSLGRSLHSNRASVSCRGSVYCKDGNVSITPEVMGKKVVAVTGAPMIRIGKGKTGCGLKFVSAMMPGGVQELSSR
jgi:hypothetical protein